MNKNMPVGLGWLLALIIIAGFAASVFLGIRRRKKAGLPAAALSVGWPRSSGWRSRC